MDTKGVTVSILCGWTIGLVVLKESVGGCCGRAVPHQALMCLCPLQLGSKVMSRFSFGLREISLSGCFLK